MQNSALILRIGNYNPNAAKCNEHFDATSFLQQFTDLQQLFITSQAEVVDKVENGETYNYGDIKIEHAHGEKCERCWNYSDVK